MSGTESVNGGSTAGGVSSGGSASGDQFGEQLSTAARNQNNIQFTNPLTLQQFEVSVADLAGNHSLMSLRPEPEENEDS